MKFGKQRPPPEDEQSLTGSKESLERDTGANYTNISHVYTKLS